MREERGRPPSPLGDDEKRALIFRAHLLWPALSASRPCERQVYDAALQFECAKSPKNPDNPKSTSASTTTTPAKLPRRPTQSVYRNAAFSLSVRSSRSTRSYSFSRSSADSATESPSCFSRLSAAEASRASRRPFSRARIKRRVSEATAGREHSQRGAARQRSARDAREAAPSEAYSAIHVERYLTDFSSMKTVYGPMMLRARGKRESAGRA